MTDEYYMQLVMQLARRGRGHVSPNPLVGAVIIKNGKIIGQGYHERYGSPHAEINAIQNAAKGLKAATLYVNLEPCCHTGKTPPCVDCIVKHKIGRVVIGAADPNPLVSGLGIKILKKTGIEVVSGILEEECRNLNEVFYHYMEKGLPFVTVKYAQTLDGRIATKTGESQWISSPSSRKFSHQLRAEHDAVLIGAGTVIKDDPELTVRLARGRNPLRVIVASQLNISEQAKIFQNQKTAKTLIATTRKAASQWQRIAHPGIEIITVPADKQGNVNLKELLKMLAVRNISSVLIEGGAQIITSTLRNNLANRLVTIIAPKIIGQGIEAVGDLSIKNLSAAKKLSFQKIRRLGPDIIIDSRIE